MKSEGNNVIPAKAQACVIPAKAGIQDVNTGLDSGFRRNDGHMSHYYCRDTRKVIFVSLVITLTSLAFGDTLITETHLTSPYYLDTPNERYILQGDVTADKTAFVIIAEGITLDLGGHTVTYDDALPITVPNGDFEDGGLGPSAPGWDFTGAPDADVSSGTIINPVTVFSGTKALRFHVPAGDQFIASTSQVTLEPDTTYVLSFKAFNAVPGPLENHNNTTTLFAKFKSTSTEVVVTGICWRGFQYATAVFRTGSAPESYTIQVGIRGAAQNINPPGGYVYVDDVRVERYQCFGVLFGPPSWARDYNPYVYPDVTRFGSADHAVITNGSLIQGRGGAAWGHGLKGASGSGGEFSYLTITVRGANTFNIAHDWGTRHKIHHNTFNNQVNVITSRDQFDGAVVSLSGGSDNEIYSNTILGGCQNGIVANTGQGAPNRIYDNDITLGGTPISRTNGFAIQLYGDQGTEAYNNRIHCGDGQNWCRGIFTGGNARGTRIYNNTIDVQNLANNQEYGGCQGGSGSGAYGIQIESSDDLEIYGNVVTAIANDCAATAFRVNGALANRGIYVHDNQFTAINRSPLRAEGLDPQANSIKIGGGIDNPNATLRFENNVIRSNYRWFSNSDISNLEFRSNTFVIGDDPVSPFEPLVAYRYSESDNGAVRHIRFINNQYLDTASQNAFVNTSIFKKFYYNFGTDPLSSFHYSWTLRINAVDENNRPVANRIVLIEDKDGREVVRALTDDAGRVETVLDEFLNEGGAKTFYNDYTATLFDGNFEVSASVTMDQPRELTLRLPYTASEVTFGQDINIIQPGVSPEVRLTMNLTQNEDVRIRIVNRQGELMKELANGAYIAGPHIFIWDGSNNNGEKVASGIYTAVIDIGDRRTKKRIAVVK
ncbi:MAG: hypothetical protein LHV69_03570 [Elusimicrobia bacterium]|nr:hypothetical protein [Candidatus Obscuribacterium magneticum]